MTLKNLNYEIKSHGYDMKCFYDKYNDNIH